MSAPAGNLGEGSGRRKQGDHTAVVECNGALFVETPHLAILFGRPHRNIMRDVERLIVGGVIDTLNPERISYLDSMGRAQEAYRLCERDARRAALKQRGSAGPDLLMFMFWAAVVVTFAVVAGGA